MQGQDVVVAGDVTGAGQVIGALGESGGHPIGSLQNAHGWLCVKWGGGGKKGKGGLLNGAVKELCGSQPF